MLLFIVHVLQTYFDVLLPPEGWVKASLSSSRTTSLLPARAVNLLTASSTVSNKAYPVRIEFKAMLSLNGALRFVLYQDKALE